MIIYDLKFNILYSKFQLHGTMAFSGSLSVRNLEFSVCDFPFGAAKVRWMAIKKKPHPLMNAVFVYQIK
jgi:hypothetical protein